jgi:hypothetical protein
MTATQIFAHDLPLMRKKLAVALPAQKIPKIETNRASGNFGPLTKTQKRANNPKPQRIPLMTIQSIPTTRCKEPDLNSSFMEREAVVSGGMLGFPLGPSPCERLPNSEATPAAPAPIVKPRRIPITIPKTMFKVLFGLTGLIPGWAVSIIVTIEGFGISVSSFPASILSR